MTDLFKYKLLSFVIWHKHFRVNSCIYRGDKKYKIAKLCGISPTTYSSYLKECLLLGVVVKSNNGYVFKSLTSVITILFQGASSEEEILNLWKHRRFWRGCESGISDFKSINDLIKISILKQNYNQQVFIIEQKKRALFISRNCTKVKTSSAYERIHGINKAQSFCRTGKFHLAKLVGCSPSTASCLLKNWHKGNKIIRKVVYLKTNLDSTFQLNKRVDPGFFLRNGVWMKALGSKISITSP